MTAKDYFNLFLAVSEKWRAHAAENSPQKHFGSIVSEAQSCVIEPKTIWRTKRPTALHK